MDETQARLMQAIKDNDFILVVSLIGDYPDLLPGEAGPNNPLIVAAGAGHADIVAQLEEWGATVGAEDNALYTAFVTANRERRIQAVRLLLELGVTWKEAVISWHWWEFDDDWLAFGETPAEVAYAQELVALGAPYDVVLARYAQYDFQKEAVSEAMVKRLIAMGVDGGAALLVAAECGSPEFARVLLENGTDPMPRNKEGQTPLHLCALPDDSATEGGWGFYGDQVAALLLDKGAEVDAIDAAGVTPLIDCAWGDDEDQSEALARLARLLIDRGASINRTDEFGSTPLHHAAQSGSLAVARVLVDGGADLGAKDLDGASPYDDAVAAGETEMADYLSTSPPRMGASRL